MFKVARKVRKRGGCFALFSHISTLLFGRPRFINSCSTIDLKDAKISFAENISGLIQYLLPDCESIKFQKALNPVISVDAKKKEADEVKKSNKANNSKVRVNR